MAEFTRVAFGEGENSGIATVYLNRPPLNALGATMPDELILAATALSENADVRAVVLYGGDRVFSAGGDIKEFAVKEYADHLRTAGRVSHVAAAIAEIRHPVIAAVAGWAVGGGCELALAADFRVCAEDAKWGLPEVKLGLLPGAGGTQRLPRLVGVARAKRLIMSGRTIGAAEALRIGLVDEVVPASDVLTAAWKLAAEFTSLPPIAVQNAKAAIDIGASLDLASALRVETHLIHPLFATDDTRAAIASFLTSGPRAAPPDYLGR
jgi:enoyl-CoA hydratase/carnithine racemase